MVQSNHLNASLELSSKLEADLAGNLEQDARTKFFYVLRDGSVVDSRRSKN